MSLVFDDLPESRLFSPSAPALKARYESNYFVTLDNNLGEGEVSEFTAKGHHLVNFPPSIRCLFLTLEGL